MSLAAVSFMAPNGRFRNMFVTDGGSIISDNGTFHTDGAGNLTTKSVISNNFNASVDPSSAGTLQLVESSSVQTLVNGANIAAINNTTVLRTTAAANVTALSMPAPISGNGQLSLIVNTSSHTMTFDVANNSGMGDGTSAVIVANRMILSVWSNTEGFYYHT